MTVSNHSRQRRARPADNWNGRARLGRLDARGEGAGSVRHERGVTIHNSGVFFSAMKSAENATAPGAGTGFDLQFWWAGL